MEVRVGGSRVRGELGKRGQESGGRGRGRRRIVPGVTAAAESKEGRVERERERELTGEREGDVVERIVVDASSEEDESRSSRVAGGGGVGTGRSASKTVSSSKAVSKAACQSAEKKQKSLKSYFSAEG